MCGKEGFFPQNSFVVQAYLCAQKGGGGGGPIEHCPPGASSAREVGTLGLGLGAALSAVIFFMPLARHYTRNTFLGPPTQVPWTLGATKEYASERAVYALLSFDLRTHADTQKAFA
jgi:hypothetical protein